MRSVPREVYDDLNKRYDELLSKYHDLVGESLKRPPVPVQPIHIEVSDSTDDNFPVGDKIMEAIHTESEPESIEADVAQEAAFGMLRRGADEEDVIAAVLTGEDIPFF